MVRCCEQEMCRRQVFGISIRIRLGAKRSVDKKVIGSPVLERVAHQTGGETVWGPKSVGPKKFSGHRFWISQRNNLGAKQSGAKKSGGQQDWGQSCIGPKRSPTNCIACRNATCLLNTYPNPRDLSTIPIQASA